MATAEQADDRHAHEALHSEAVARLSAALGVVGPETKHAERLARLLGVERLSAPEVTTTTLHRTAVFGGAIVDDRSNAPASTSYSTLQEALPDWYEAHNRHCGSCQVPMFIGLNANFGRLRRDRVITCGRCNTLNVIEAPSKEAKSVFRSQKVRAARAKTLAAQSIPKRRNVDEAVGGPSRTTAVEKAPSTLAERQAELRRKAKDAKKAATKPLPTASPSPKVDVLEAKGGVAPIEAAVPAIPAHVSAQPQPDSTRLSSNKRKQARPKGPRLDRETLALQSMLEKNRKRQEEKNKKVAPKTGLQDFLGSL